MWRIDYKSNDSGKRRRCEEAPAHSHLREEEKKQNHRQKGEGGEGGAAQGQMEDISGLAGQGASVPPVSPP